MENKFEFTDFEQQLIHDIIEWLDTVDHNFSSPQEAVEAFWAEKLE